MLLAKADSREITRQLDASGVSPHGGKCLYPSPIPYPFDEEAMSWTLVTHKGYYNYCLAKIWVTQI